MRTVEWDHEKSVLKLIDQRLLPSEFTIMELSSHTSVYEAIQDMVVRGAPAIGAAAAFGMALAALNFNESEESLPEFLHKTGAYLKQARPTAVNLAWAVDRILSKLDHQKLSLQSAKSLVLQEALSIADEDVAINKKMAEYGASLLEDGDTVIHHCNTGALATVDWGTALGVIRFAHEQGKNIHVLVDETRPRLQGARLTAWELEQYKIPYEIITDNAAGYFLAKKTATKVIFGADRAAANGDIANKIGTYMLALAAHHNQAEVIAVVPTSTIDTTLSSGKEIPIEERNPSEVLDIEKQQRPIAPTGAKARNPAFDITPHQLITHIVTEKGVITPPFENKIKTIMEK